MYSVVNETSQYEIIQSNFKTKEEAKQFIKELKAFDKRQGNPFNEKYIIVIERRWNKW